MTTTKSAFSPRPTSATSSGVRGAGMWRKLASEPWYSIGPLDVFPEEFPPFLFADAGQRKLFDELHGELYNADYWKGLQEAIRAGKVIDVFPYRRKEQL